MRRSGPQTPCAADGGSCNIVLHGPGSPVNCLGRRVTSCATRDAKEIAKPLAIQTSIDFLKYE